MEKFSLRQKSDVDLCERVLLFKRTIRQWIYFIGLKYLETHKLSDTQEAFLGDITTYFVKQIDAISEDRNFFKKSRIK